MLYTIPELIPFRNQVAVSRGEHDARNAKSIFFPTLPSPALPQTLPLVSYAGTYYHAGYQTLTIYFDPSTKDLHADRSGSLMPEHLCFKHVSGDYFLITSHGIGDLNALFPQNYPAEFRISADGKVEQVGIRWEEEMGEDKIWLKRVDE